MTSWKPDPSFFQKQIRGNFISLNPHDIVRIPECQPRVDGTDEKVVDEYAQDMRDYDAFYADHDPPIPGWKKFPRIQCVHDPQIGYILFSGNHRLEAILQVGYPDIEVHYFTGTRQDAIVLSKKENAKNGKRRTNADKAHVVKSCLLDAELKMWSNEQIAKWCGVAPKTVKNHEDALCKLQSENGELYTRPTRRKRLSNTGEIEWIETASIGNGSEKSDRKEKQKTESPKESVERRENGCRSRLRSILNEHHKLDSTTYDVGALAKEFELYAVRVEVIARDLVAKEIEKAQGNWQKAWTKVRTAWFDYEELSKSVEWETFTAAVLDQVDMRSLTNDTFENPDNRLNSNDLELLISEKDCLITLGYHIRNPSFWVSDLIPDSDEQPVEQTEKDSPSLSEKTEALKSEVKEYLPTWKEGNPDTTYATLFHLLDARFRIKHGVPRGRSPFFFEELDGLLPLMKVNDLELADKVREILATDPSGVKSAVESEADDESPFEYPKPDTPDENADLNGKEKGSEKTLSDVLGEDRIAFITVCLREPKPMGISGKGKLNYITFDAEDDRMQSCIDISEIPEPLLAQLIAIAKEKS